MSGLRHKLHMRGRILTEFLVDNTFADVLANYSMFRRMIPSRNLVISTSFENGRQAKSNSAFAGVKGSTARTNFCSILRTAPRENTHPRSLCVYLRMADYSCMRSSKEGSEPGHSKYSTCRLARDCRMHCRKAIFTGLLLLRTVTASIMFMSPLVPNPKALASHVIIY